LRRLLLTGLALLAVPALALAGATATDGTDTLKIKAKFDPAQASKRTGDARPIEFKLDYFAGTTDDSRIPDVRSVSVFAGGAVIAHDAFPKCDESDLIAEGPSACPKGSKVGVGKAVAEVHPPDSTTTKSEVPVDVVVFNAKAESDRNGDFEGGPVHDGILFYTEVAGTKLALPFWAEDGNKRLTYYNPEEDTVPPADNALYTVKEVHVTFPRRSVRRNGKRIPWMAAPRKCNGSWTASMTNDRYEGGPLTAKHKIRCTKAP
jgi:hypothetical protein